jgi:NAD(P)-dependent dehydrogenase (short-subunit alcohol dehydrogenase family)
MNTYDLKGKTAVITGARRGIGKGCALRMAKSGARVAVTDLNEQDCQAVVKEIEASGGSAIALPMDVSNEDSVSAAVRKITDAFHRIDILVNNAGIYIAKDLIAMDRPALEKEIAINLMGPIICIRHVLPGMQANTYGKIVNIASISGLIGYPSSSIYCATKGALVTLTKELALELGKYRINVNAIAPGAIATAMSADVINNEEMKKATLAKIPCGRIGDLTEETDFNTFSSEIKEVLKIDNIYGVKCTDRVKKVAVVSGSGKDFILDAKKAGADTFLTGEVNHSGLIEVKELGLNIICGTHYATENTVLPWLKELLLKGFPDLEVAVMTFAAEDEYGV